MKLNEYHDKAMSTNAESSDNIVYSLLGLNAEVGLEVAFEDGEWMHTINLHEYTIHTISGVHHIQHLLRLYGCEKEINL